MKRHPIIGTLLILFLIVVVVGIISAVKNSPGSGDNTAIVSNPSTPLRFGDGNYVVGTDVQPGTYRTRAGALGCNYKRLSGLDGTIGEVVANVNTDAPSVITILPSDKGFDSLNCGIWTENLSPITNSSDTFGDGVFIIGTDIAPGTYQRSGTGGCYYARLSGFSGTTDDVIGNTNFDTSGVVTIASTDKGFESAGCGTWSLAK